MKIEDNKLLIDTPMSEDDVEELLAAIKQSQIDEIVVENDDLHASIVQALWCAKSNKKVTIQSDFLKPFFEHVA